MPQACSDVGWQGGREAGVTATDRVQGGSQGPRTNLCTLSTGPEWTRTHVSGATLPCLQCHVSGPREQGFLGLRWHWGFRTVLSSLLESRGPWVLPEAWGGGAYLLTPKTATQRRVPEEPPNQPRCHCVAGVGVGGAWGRKSLGGSF